MADLRKFAILLMVGSASAIDLTSDCLTVDVVARLRSAAGHVAVRLEVGVNLCDRGHAAHYPARAIRAIIVPRLPHV